MPFRKDFLQGEVDPQQGLPVEASSRPDDDLVFGGAQVAVTINALRPDSDTDATYRVVVTPSITRGEVRAANARFRSAGLPALLSEEVHLPPDLDTARDTRRNKMAQRFHSIRPLRSIFRGSRH